MTDAVGTSQWRVSLDASKADAGLKTLAREAKTTGDAAEHAFGGKASAAAGQYTGVLGRLQGRLGGLNSTLGQKSLTSGLLQGVGIGAGIGAFSLVTGAISGGIDMLRGFAEAARQDAADTAKMTTALKANVPGWDGNTKAIDARIAAGAKLAFSDDDIRDSMSKLIVRTHDVSKALDLQSLAMDVARGRDIKLSEATDLVGKASSGQIAALRKAGIAIDANATSTQALAALQKAYSGQAAAFGATDEGIAQANAIAWKEVGESIGKLVLPVFNLFAQVMRDVILPAVQTFVDLVIQNAPVAVAALGAIAAVVVGTLVPAFVGWAVATLAATWPLLAIGAAVAALALAFQTNFMGIQDIVTGVFKVIQDVFNTLLNLIGRGISLLLDPIRAMVDLASKVPGPWQDGLGKIRDSIDATQNALEALGTTASVSSQQASAAVEQAAAAVGDAQLTISAAFRQEEEGYRSVAAVSTEVADQQAADFERWRALAEARQQAVLDSDRAIIKSIEGLGPDMKKGLQDGEDSVKAGMKNLIWVMNHPWAAEHDRAKLEGILHSKKIQEGLASQNPFVRAAAQAEVDAINAELAKLPPAGYRASTAWGKAFVGGIYDYSSKINKALSDATGGMVGQSPPKVGPLRHIGIWGRNVAKAWVEPFVKTLSDARLGMNNALGAGVGMSLVTSQTVRHQHSGVVQVALSGSTLQAARAVGMSPGEIGQMARSASGFSEILDAASRAVYHRSTSPSAA